MEAIATAHATESWPDALATLAALCALAVAVALNAAACTKKKTRRVPHTNAADLGDKSLFQSKEDLSKQKSIKTGEDAAAAKKDETPKKAEAQLKTDKSQSDSKSENSKNDEKPKVEAKEDEGQPKEKSKGDAKQKEDKKEEEKQVDKKEKQKPLMTAEPPPAPKSDYADVDKGAFTGAKCKSDYVDK